MNRSIYILSLILFFSACKKDDSGPVSEENRVFPVTLVFPFNNSECNEGTHVTNIESTVLFEWLPDPNSGEYLLTIMNLDSADLMVQSTAETRIPVVLKRGTPYSWCVASVSIEQTDTAVSEVWKFYNAGEGIESYAPFPAEIISPAFAEKVEYGAGYISLVWSGSDIDNDITGYDVYFGTDSSFLELLESNLQNNWLDEVQVVSGTIYYWKVVTRDSNGNTSDSGIYQFKVL